MQCRYCYILQQQRSQRCGNALSFASTSTCHVSGPSSPLESIQVARGCLHVALTSMALGEGLFTLCAQVPPKFSTVPLPLSGTASVHQGIFHPLEVSLGQAGIWNKPQQPYDDWHKSMLTWEGELDSIWIEIHHEPLPPIPPAPRPDLLMSLPSSMQSNFPATLVWAYLLQWVCLHSRACSSLPTSRIAAQPLPAQLYLHW